MDIINVQYNAFKILFGTASICHQDDNGTRVQLFGLTRDFYVRCLLLDPADISDFNSNYLSQSTLVSDLDEAILMAATAPLPKLSSLGVQGVSPAKGLGGFAPDPTNNPYLPALDETTQVYVDAWGQTMVRGPVITDEGSVRDDFTGSALETTLTGTLSFTNGSNEVTGSGTLFTEELNRDFYVKLESDTSFTYWVRVQRSIDDETLLLEEEYQGSTGSGTAHKTRWVVPISGTTPGTYSVGSSNLVLASGTGTNGTVRIYRNGDYMPCLTVWRIAISQRIANQTIHFGFRNLYVSPTMYADVVLTGTDNTLVTFKTAWNLDEESSTVSLPAGLTTAQTLRFKIDAAPTYCSLLVNGVLIAKHENHVPDPYAAFLICAGIVNSGSVTNTNLTVDSVYFANTDQLQVSNIFTEPMSVVTTEDQHSVIGKLTTVLTTAEQTIISYTVPAGRVFYLIGHQLSSVGTINGTMKIGRNSCSTDPTSPGTLDGPVFRVINMVANGNFNEEFGANPRKIGVGGDTILVTVTPSSLLSTVWRAHLDFVLR